MPDDDLSLLGQYAASRSEAAFATVVERNTDFVYSAAFRQVRDSHLAGEVTQAVFIILARKAGSFNPKIIFSGWLYRTTYYVSRGVQKREARRQRLEQEAYMESLTDDLPADSNWEHLAPLLDEGMLRLRDKDRQAILLRYFENKTLRDVGMALGVEERAAQKRVDRALEKLRLIFARRGVTFSAVALVAAVSANSVQAAPAGLALTTAVTAAKGVTASSSTLTLIKGALKVMAWTKAKTTIVAGIGILLFAGTATVAVKEIQAARKPYSWEVSGANFGTFYKSPPMVVIVPTKIDGQGSACADGGRGAMGIAQPLDVIIQLAYGKDPVYTIPTKDLPAGKYDFFAKLVPAQEPHKNMLTDTNWTIELQKEIVKKFGIRGRIEERDTDVLVMQPVPTGTRGFKESHSMKNGRAVSEGPGDLAFFQQPVGTLRGYMETHFNIPIVDETGLTEAYDFEVKWNEPDSSHPNLDALKQALSDQLGLQLVPGRRSIEMLVIDRVK